MSKLPGGGSMIRLVDPAVDPWHRPACEAGAGSLDLAAKPYALLDLLQWEAVRRHWPGSVPVGVRLPNEADPAALAADLPRLALIALQFPKWTDGRAYSQARLLRVRHGFRGELRAEGDVIADMMPLLARTGFDAACLRAGQRPESARRALGFFDAHYQDILGQDLVGAASRP
jgi:uncharacterized protein (DUF934 family)